MKKILLFFSILFLFVVTAVATSILKSPTDCDGTWIFCDSALSDDMLSSGADPFVPGIWYNYGFNDTNGTNTSNSTNVTSVKVRLDAFKSTALNTWLEVKVSGDSGSSYGPSHSTPPLTFTEDTYWIDVTGDWAWDMSALSDGNFVVHVTCKCSGYNCVNTLKNICALEWVPVEVTTSP